jgi:hypothetical protein
MALACLCFHRFTQPQLEREHMPKGEVSNRGLGRNSDLISITCFWAALQCAGAEGPKCFGRRLRIAPGVPCVAREVSWLGVPRTRSAA